MVDWHVVARSLPAFAQGLRVCLTLLLSVATGFLLSVPLAVARVSSRRAWWLPVWCYTYVFRGTPLLVQLFVVYHGFAKFEVVRATPHGEVEAARAYGLTGWTLYRRILLPSALRRALPQYSNEVVGMMHATAIASTVTLVDVTRGARDVYANHLLPVEAFGIAALIYFALTFTLVGGFKLLERRFLRHLQTERRPAAGPLPNPT